MSGVSQQAYLNLFESVVNAAFDKIGGSLLQAAVVHGEELQSARFEGPINYCLDSDTYKADALRGSTADKKAVIVRKSIRGRDDVAVLVADWAQGTATQDELRRVATRILNKVHAVMADAKL